MTVLVVDSESAYLQFTNVTSHLIENETTTVFGQPSLIQMLRINDTESKLSKLKYRLQSPEIKKYVQHVNIG